MKEVFPSTPFKNFKKEYSYETDHDSGIFENGSLKGLVYAAAEKELGIAEIEIYVNRQSRRKGYAKRLLLAICGTNPDVMYCYSCIKTNVASANTAKSCGFEFKGAYLLVE